MLTTNPSTLTLKKICSLLTECIYGFRMIVGVQAIIALYTIVLGTQ
jgi:hypothetical protein